MANYESINIAEMMEEENRLATAGKTDNDDYLKNFVRMPTKEGFVTVRLLPPGKGKKFFCTTRIHRINNKNIHCPRVQTVAANGRKFWKDQDPKNPCPICKYVSNLYDQAKELPEGSAEQKAMKDAASQIKANERYYYNTIVRSEVDPKSGEVTKNVGPKILSIGVTLHERIVRAFTGNKKLEEEPLGDVTDFKTGRDLKVIKEAPSGKNAYANYDNSKFLDQSPLGEKDQIEKWLDNLHDLASLRKLVPMEQMKIELKKHLGLIQSDDDSGFDIKEFQKPAAGSVSLEAQVQAAQKVAAKSDVEAKVDKPVVEATSDAVLAEDDFLAELQNM